MMRIYVFFFFKFVADCRMTRNEELDLLQSAELKQAFDEFDKVHIFKYEVASKSMVVA